MREDWASAIGIEVENKRMLGKRTLFVYDYPIPVDADVEHIYFTRQFLDNHGFNEVITLLLQMDRYKSCWFVYPKGTEITLELSLSMLNKVPDELKQCHFVVSIDMLGLDEFIKNSDTIRLILGDYHTVSITYCDMVEATPNDYKLDKPGSKKRI